MTQNYELYLIFSPELSSDEVKTEVENVTNVLETSLKATNLNVELEGLKKLAYPIKKKNSGFYVLFAYDVALENLPKNQEVEGKLNLNENIVRYIVVNQTEYLKEKEKETLNKEPETETHRELNKGKGPKKCVCKYLGMQAVDYKDSVFLEQFTSPYAKIFARGRTGTSAKFQRKVTKAIKRARHMALMPFTPKYSE